MLEDVVRENRVERPGEPFQNVLDRADDHLVQHRRCALRRRGVHLDPGDPRRPGGAQARPGGSLAAADVEHAPERTGEPGDEIGSPLSVVALRLRGGCEDVAAIVGPYRTGWPMRTR